jgi:hypothetical protein
MPAVFYIAISGYPWLPWVFAIGFGGTVQRMGHDFCRSLADLLEGNERVLQEMQNLRLRHPLKFKPVAIKYSICSNCLWLTLLLCLFLHWFIQQLLSVLSPHLVLLPPSQLYLRSVSSKAVTGGKKSKASGKAIKPVSSSRPAAGRGSAKAKASSGNSSAKGTGSSAWKAPAASKPGAAKTPTPAGGAGSGAAAAGPKKKKSKKKAK